MRRLLFLAEIRTGKFLLEFFNTASCVDEFLFAREKGVRGTGDIHAYQRIFIAIFPLDGIFGLDRRAGEDGKIGRYVLKDNGSVVRVDVAFHLQHFTFVDSIRQNQLYCVLQLR